MVRRMTRAFGQTGLEVPVLGFGAMQVGDPTLAEEAVARLLHHVLDRGLTLIDTARSYGLAEERIGRHLAARRDEFVLSTKVGYGVPGVPDWTYECIVRGVDAARERLRTDVIDIVHLHSCGLDVLQAGEVTRGLLECVARGKIRVAAYSGDAAPLRFAVTSPAQAGEVARSAGSGASGPGAGAATGNSGHVFETGPEPPVATPANAIASRDAALAAASQRVSFGSVQASVNLCDQQSLATLAEAQRRGLGTIAKRSLAGRPWAGGPGGDPVHDEYRRRFELLRAHWQLDVQDWDAFALRFAAFAPGVDCVIVGGTDAANVDRNVAAVERGPLMMSEQAAIRAAFENLGHDWAGLI